MFKETIELIKEDQPGYRILIKGRSALTNTELLSMVIGSPDGQNLDIAKQILLDYDGSLNNFFKTDYSSLVRYANIGDQTAKRIIAMFEISNRRHIETYKNKKKITCSRDVYTIMEFLKDSNYEEFWILLLNRSNKVIRMECVGQGGISGTVADPKKIFKKALDHFAASVILCHNHPSGNIKPSESDTRLTQKLKKAGSFLDLPVIDHIIIGENNYFSFADDGLL